MIISEQHKYIYLACPKTGTVSVERFLMEQDSTAFRNKIVIDGHLIKFAGHSKIKDIKKKLHNNLEDYQVIGFVRHPYSRIVSSYFFYKNGKPITKGSLLNYKGNFSAFLKALANLFKVYLSRIISFQLWALLYPYKSNKEFFVDEKNEIIVQHIGLFENLDGELAQILKRLDLDFDISKLKKINKSKHEVVSTYFKNRFFKKLINLKVRKDLRFYKSVEQRK